MRTEQREVWVQRVRRLGESGLSAKEFARELGVNAHTLAGWRWRLSREEAEGAPVVAAPEPKAQFVEVAPEASPAPREARPSREQFEVVLCTGRRVLVPAVFDSRALRALVTALEVA